MTLISVIIPCYNSERFVKRAIDSVLAQTFKDYEIVVVDDGSTDSTAEKVKKYGSLVRYLHQENRGLPAARNSGIKIAQGKYIALLDDDDWWVPEKLEKQLKILATSPRAAMVYCDATVVYESGDPEESFLAQFRYGTKLPRGRVRSQLIEHNFILPSTVLIVRDCLDKVGGFDESFRAVEDLDFWLRLASNWEIEVVPEPLIFRREGSHNMTANAERISTYALRALEKANSTLALDRSEKKLLNHKSAQYRWNLGYGYFKKQQFRDAREQFAEAMKCDWRNWRSLPYWILSFMPTAMINSMSDTKRRLFSTQVHSSR
ncbi:MAG TPA: glycosyltransferase [Terriglobales bacterium]|nr:glycosyltransferase [Terriglobales bacterium]